MKERPQSTTRGQQQAPHSSPFDPQTPSSRGSGLYARSATLASLESTIDRARQFSEQERTAAPPTQAPPDDAFDSTSALVCRCLDLLDDFGRALAELAPTAIPSAAITGHVGPPGDEYRTRWKRYAERHRTLSEHLALKRSAFAASARAHLRRFADGAELRSTEIEAQRPGSK